MSVSTGRTGTPVNQLADRLRTVAAILLESPLQQSSAPAGLEAAHLIDDLVRAVAAKPEADRVWLLFVAVSGRFPTSAEVVSLRRNLELLDSTQATLALLDDCARHPEHSTSIGRRIELLVGAVLLDVDHVSRHDIHTGIQQVVRRTVPHWAEDDVILTAWADGGRALRRLDDVETDRVRHWNGPIGRPANAGPQGLDAQIVVPWRSVVVMMDAPRDDAALELTALASQSGSRLVAVGYDCIPVLSPHLLPAGAADVFARFLAILKHARRIAGISESARVEFVGFSETLATQGLPGPVVFNCPLPAEPHLPHEGSDAPGVPAERPFLLTVGSFEPRKNHIAVLHAAERLWLEGLEFGVLMIGGGRSSNEVFDRVAALQAAGRDVTVLQGVAAEVLDDAFARARFLVFPSVHEGYGLPIAEAFAHGTPALTSDFGSTAEIAADGGAITIDPRDDAALLREMRRLLTDDALIASLRSQIAARPTRTWAQYASRLWADLVAPELADLQAAETGGPTTLKSKVS